MSNEMSKELKCIVVRGGMEIWLEADKLEPLVSAIEKGGMMRIEGNLVNAKDIVGVFDAKTMEEVTRRKNGEYKCRYGEWHKKFSECGCGELIKLYGGIIKNKG